ncbi:MAG TPA: 16S rRNA (adenine(1518)-N(6)/adenine(1519)-N(6))-dimethyltransferase RsmA [bacterium]|nr:16S rRNA (adenine(1518)-N(6)/adenine(1519)-N(6))-dimethyltransferase RsmA [bacterium]
MRQKWGQHFLRKKEAAARIVSFLSISPSDRVLEVGPGKGMLTEHLIPAKEVLAVEIDGSLADSLRERFGRFQGFSAVNGDILEMKEELGRLTGNKKEWKITGNLPYYLTSKFLSFMAGLDFFRLAVLMLQKEAAGKLLAVPGSGKYVVSTVDLRNFFRIEKMMDLKKGEFTPPPEVDSSVLRFERIRPALSEKDRRGWIFLLRRIFSRKRKKLSVSLRGLFCGAEEMLLSSGISPSARPEEILPERYWDFFQNNKAGVLAALSGEELP